MKIKIISDGTAQNTQVVNAETDEPIEQVVDINIHIGMHDSAVVVLTVLCPVIQYTGSAKVIKDWRTIYKDGNAKQSV